MAKMITPTRVVAGRQIMVENLGRKPAANKWYLAVWVEDPDGKNEECLLFTESQIRVARERARKNPEDLTRKSLLTDILD